MPGANATVMPAPLRGTNVKLDPSLFSTAVTTSQKLIDPLSVCSLLVESTVNGNPLSTATGFVVLKKEKPFLITNWHVVAGRDPNTNQPLSPTAAVPDQLSIVHHHSQQLGRWEQRVEELYAQGKPRWREHPTGKAVDVVALPLASTDADIRFYPMDLALADVDMLVQVAMTVSIIGFPYGLATNGALPIWKTGHIASDPDIEYQGKPAFLVDATTRGGMSGSPVVVRQYGGHTDSKGNVYMGTGATTRFVGIYSGRIHEQSDVGIVWRPELLKAILP